MQINTAQKCVKRVRQAKKSNNLANVFLPRITTFYKDTHADLVYSRVKYDVISYFWSAFLEFRKNDRNATSAGFGSNFSGAAFCLPYQLVGYLLK